MSSINNGFTKATSGVVVGAVADLPGVEAAVEDYSQATLGSIGSNLWQMTKTNLAENNAQNLKNLKLIAESTYATLRSVQMVAWDYWMIPAIISSEDLVPPVI